MYFGVNDCMLLKFGKDLPSKAFIVKYLDFNINIIFNLKVNKTTRFTKWGGREGVNLTQCKMYLFFYTSLS